MNPEFGRVTLQDIRSKMTEQRNAEEKHAPQRANQSSRAITKENTKSITQYALEKTATTSESITIAARDIRALPTKHPVLTALEAAVSKRNQEPETTSSWMFPSVFGGSADSNTPLLSNEQIVELGKHVLKCYDELGEHYRIGIKNLETLALIQNGLDKDLGFYERMNDRLKEREEDYNEAFSVLLSAFEALRERLGGAVKQDAHPQGFEQDTNPGVFVKNLIEYVDAIKAELEQARLELGNRNAQTDVLESNNQHLQSRLSQAEEHIRKKEKELTALHQEYKAQVGSINQTAKWQTQDLRRQNEDYQQEITQLTQTIEQQKYELEKSKNSSTLTTFQKNEQEALNIQLKNQLTGLNSKKLKLEEELQENQALVAKLESNLNSLNRRIHEDTKKHTEFKNEAFNEYKKLQETERQHLQDYDELASNYTVIKNRHDEILKEKEKIQSQLEKDLEIERKEKRKLEISKDNLQSAYNEITSTKVPDDFQQKITQQMIESGKNDIVKLTEKLEIQGAELERVKEIEKSQASSVDQYKKQKEELEKKLAKNNTEHQDTINRLENDYSAIQKEIRNAELRAKKADSIALRHESKAKELSEQVEALEKQSSEKDSQINDLEQILRKTKLEYTRSSEENSKKLQQEIDNLQNKLRLNSEKLKSTEKSFNSKTRDLKQIKKERDELKLVSTEGNNAILELNSKIELLSSNINATNKNNEQLKRQNEDLQEKLKDSQLLAEKEKSEKYEAQQKIAALTSELDQQKTTLGHTTSEKDKNITQLTSELAALNTKLQQMSTDFNREKDERLSSEALLKLKLSDQTGKNNKITEKLAEKKTRISFLEKECENLNTEIDANKKQISQKDEELSKSKVKVKMLESKNQHFQSDIDAKSNEVDRLTSELTTLQPLKSKKVHLEKTNQTLQDENKKLKEQLKTAKESLANKSSTLSALQTEDPVIQSLKPANNSKIYELELDLAKARADYNELEAMYEIIKEEYENLELAGGAASNHEESITSFEQPPSLSITASLFDKKQQRRLNSDIDKLRRELQEKSTEVDDLTHKNLNLERYKSEKEFAQDRCERLQIKINSMAAQIENLKLDSDEKQNLLEKWQKEKSELLERIREKEDEIQKTTTNYQDDQNTVIAEIAKEKDRADQATHVAQKLEQDLEIARSTAHKHELQNNAFTSIVQGFQSYIDKLDLDGPSKKKVVDGWFDHIQAMRSENHSSDDEFSD